MRTHVRRSGLHCFDRRQVLCNVFFRPMPKYRRHGCDGFCNYFPDDSRRGVVLCFLSMKPSSESAMSAE